MWFKDYTLDFLQKQRNAGMSKLLGIEFIELGPDFLKGRMPVNEKTVQPFGILHGGASVTLSETLGSVASWLTIDPDKFRAVGLEINANHIRAMTKGNVIGTCTPLHVGKRTQVWQTDITEEGTGKRVCVSRLTVAIIDHGTLSEQKEKIQIKG